MSKLGDALREVPLPPSERARERTVALATAGGRPSGSSRGWLGNTAWPRVAVAGLAVLAVLVSPFGRDAVSWAGELIGIGDPPSVTDRPSGLPPSQDQVVIANGTAPNGAPYEIVAYATESAIVADGAGGQPCIFVDFPQTNEPGTGTCGTFLDQDQRVGFTSGHFAPSEVGLSTNSYVEGFATLNATRVTVRVVRNGSVAHTGDVHLARLDGQLQQQVGAAHPANIFVAFLPRETTLEDVSSGEVTVEATAYGANGAELGRDTLVARR